MGLKPRESIDEFHAESKELMKKILPMIGFNFVMIVVAEDGAALVSTVQPETTKAIVDDIHQSLKSGELGKNHKEYNIDDD